MATADTVATAAGAIIIGAGSFRGIFRRDVLSRPALDESGTRLFRHSYSRSVALDLLPLMTWGRVFKFS